VSHRDQVAGRSLYLGASRQARGLGKASDGAGKAAYHGLVRDAFEGGDLAEGEAAAETHLDDGELFDGEDREVEVRELLGE